MNSETVTELSDPILSAARALAIQTYNDGRGRSAGINPVAIAAWADLRRLVLQLRAEASPTIDRAPEWRCLHCDEVFIGQAAAIEHFGTYQTQDPACTIDIAKFRAMEETHRRHCEEDTDAHREFYALQAKHTVALREEEQRGYDKGLAEGRAPAINREKLVAFMRTTLERYTSQASETSQAIYHEALDNAASVSADAFLREFVPGQSK